MENIEMETLDNSNDDMGNWCRRLRTRKSSVRLSASGQADTTDNISLQEELSDRKISVRPSPKKQQNQRATDTAKRTPTTPCERNPTSSKPKKSTEVPKASPPTPAPPADTGICDSLPSGPSLPQPTSPQLPENHSGSQPVAINGVFTCGSCRFHSRDIVTFLQHTHNGVHGLPLNEVSLASPALPLKYELDTQTPSKQDYTAKHKAAMARMRKGRKYTWRRKDIKAKVEEDASPELKLFLTKHPQKPNSWMARGFLSVENEILDENGFLLNPEKTIEATNKYLERGSIKEDRSGMKFLIKEELENGSHHSAPVSQPPPRNGTSSSPVYINPSSTELARLMERNNISIPPNCTTQVQGFKMVNGRKHLVLKVVPVAGKEPVEDNAESSTSPSEHITFDTKTTLPEDSAQTDPNGSLNELQECNMISANGTANSSSSPQGTVTGVNASPPEKPAHVQSGGDQGIDDEQQQGFLRLRLSLSPDREPVSENGPEVVMIDAVQSAEQETEKRRQQQQPNETSVLQSLPAVAGPANETTCGLQCDADQLSEDEARAGADVSENDECLSPAADGFWLSLDSDSDDCHGDGPASPPSPSKPNSRPASPPMVLKEKGKKLSHPDDSTSIKDNRECHVPESSSDADGKSVEICEQVLEAVKSPPPLQVLSRSPSQASCPENSVTLVSASCDVTAHPNTELRIVSPPTCTQDAVEQPGGPEPTPQNTETPITHKRPRDSSAERTEEEAPDGRPLPKLSRTLDSQEEGAVSIALGDDSLLTVQGGSPDGVLKGATDGTVGGSPVTVLLKGAAADTASGALPGSALGDTPHTALNTAGEDSASEGAPPAAVESEPGDSSSRHVERTLRLFPFCWFQLVTQPEGEDQPVVVLNHPDAEVPEVTDIMRVVHKHGSEVQKVRLCATTLKALNGDRDGSGNHEQERDRDQDRDRDGDSGEGDERSSDASLSSGVGAAGAAGPLPLPSPSPGRSERRRSTVKERFQLKMKLRRSGQNAFQVVNADRQAQPCLRCWFCGRAFTRQHELISHEQRHVLDNNGDLCTWSKTGEGQ